tara:strand:+ start:250 stop:477 length:228 start_codon:yes stop_codon:yes gene_type:complete
VIINRKYLRQLIEQVISEQELSPQEIEDAPRSDQALMDAMEKLEARMDALTRELEAVKKERDNALIQMRAITGQQ